jgi:hypothetical protein
MNKSMLLIILLLTLLISIIAVHSHGASKWVLWEVTRDMTSSDDGAKEWTFFESFDSLDDCEKAKSAYFEEMLSLWKNIKPNLYENLEIHENQGKIILKNGDRMIEERFFCLPQ